MRDGDWFIGWGAATACYPTNIAPAAARVRLTSDGHALVQTAGHELGTGASTAIAIVAADRLQIPIDSVTVELGDSDLPPAPVAGGSNNTASVCNCVAQACEQVARQRGKSKSAVLEAYVESVPQGLSADSVRALYGGHVAMARGVGADNVRFAFGAELVEVRVHALTLEIRVPRIVGAFAAGSIINPMAARSQLMGGLIWGISSALHEATVIDPRAARYVNADLTGYLLPVNADVSDVEVILVPEQDSQVNGLGIKGLGELGNVGTAAAVASAVYHATGRRIRELPIRIEKLL
jgi:xanthine dehydrogenase YagR molybdenum-binding subunit